MSSTRPLLELARRQMQIGQTDGAIDNLSAYLGENPQDAHAHALMAMCLHDRRRLTAAEHEARAALALDANDAFAHVACGQVAQAQRKPRAALAHFEAAQALAPEWDVPLRQLAWVYLYWGKPRQAREFVARALALDPDSDNRALAAHIALELGEVAEAERGAREVLRQDPAHGEGLSVLGHALLRQNRLQEARETALWAVRNAPTSRGAIALLLAVKMRQNPLTGWIWRLNAFLASGSSRRTIVSLLGVYLAIRVATLLLEDYGLAPEATMLSYAWLGFCVYSWVAPVLFQRALKRELDDVQLHERF